MAGEHTRCTGQERHRPRHRPPQSRDLEALERLSPTKPGRDMSRARKRPGGSFSRRLDVMASTTAVVTPVKVMAWSQTSSATVELKALISSAMASAGVFQPRVFQPRVFLGRRFINLATSLGEVCEASLRSRPLGMNWRRNRLVLLFDPRGLGACGSQNQRSIFRRRASSGWQVISDPHS